ncbi:ABC transporter permease [Virgisporangium aliadipatigenens]|uniref:ABC transporter permease n=1 Tax=Virgisporangium aliadipatigenens TaxID=741659 RepID=UPI0019441BA4|nr:ABC transporter permease [Virgisporangium aliadipatigenens]
MKALAIAAVDLRRTLRDRTNLVFVFVFPLLLVFVLGTAVGGVAVPRVGVAVAESGPLADRLVAALAAQGAGISVRRHSVGELAPAVAHGELDAGVLVPAGYDAAIRAGHAVTVEFVARPGTVGTRVGSVVRAVVGHEAGRLRAGLFVAAERGVPLDDGLRGVDGVAASLPRLSVSARTVGTDLDTGGRFDTTASTQLLLFLFVTALTASVALVETRRLGVLRRMLATPTSTAAILTGEGLGRLTVTVLQGGFMMVATALLFDVRWGDPFAAGALMLAFASVAGAAGLLMGSLARTPQLASAIGILLGLGLAALGGTMMPLEFFTPFMRTVAHVVSPHAWAVDGFTALGRGGGFGDIAVDLAVLLAVAVVLTAVACRRLRRELPGGTSRSALTRGAGRS